MSDLTVALTRWLVRIELWSLPLSASLMLIELEQPHGHEAGCNNHTSQEDLIHSCKHIPSCVSGMTSALVLHVASSNAHSYKHAISTVVAQHMDKRCISPAHCKPCLFPLSFNLHLRDMAGDAGRLDLCVQMACGPQPAGTSKA